MQEHYHIDLSSPDLLEQRSGRWLRCRLLGLLSVESRLRRVLIEPKGEQS